MRLHIPEILQQVSDAYSHAEKVHLLRQHGTEVLEQVLQYNFHPDISFALPEGAAPYKKEEDLPVGKSHTNLYREGRRLYIFLKGQAPNLKPYRREQLFIELLEGLHHTEAEVMLAVKDKRLQELYPGVTYEVARDAFDRLLPVNNPNPIKIPVHKVKLAIPETPITEAVQEDFQEAALNAMIKALEEEGDRPLVQPVSSMPTIQDSVSATATPKPKKELTEAQRAGLLKAQAARKKNAALKRAAKESSSE